MLVEYSAIECLIGPCVDRIPYLAKATLSVQLLHEKISEGE
jgi:hypothetical protein